MWWDVPGGHGRDGSDVGRPGMRVSGGRVSGGRERASSGRGFGRVSVGRERARGGRGFGRGSPYNYQHHLLIFHRFYIMYNGELPGDDTPGITRVGDTWIWNLYPLPPSLPSLILSSNWMMIPLPIYLFQLNHLMIILMIPLLLLVASVVPKLNS